MTLQARFILLCFCGTFLTNPNPVAWVHVLHILVFYSFFRIDVCLSDVGIILEMFHRFHDSNRMIFVDQDNIRVVSIRRIHKHCRMAAWIGCLAPTNDDGERRQKKGEWFHRNKGTCMAMSFQ